MCANTIGDGQSGRMTVEPQHKNTQTAACFLDSEAMAGYQVAR